ncbi:hypothetical protein [Aquipuribacter hungaricus]|uniref:VCBS repeat-containing protein n=1 Tax=Aquipuribacter hungaricus TaxID=545624 RepID=A0ABV7WF92_9MICO
MPRAATPALVVLGVGVLVAGAVLARPGTAADDAAVEATRASLEAVADPSAPVPEPLDPQGAVVVREDGVDGLRLGMGTAEVVAAGFSVQEEPVGGCRRVLPGLSDTGPGDGVAGWLVEDRLASVTVDARTGAGSSFLGPGVGARLDDLEAPGLLRATTTVPVPWQEASVTVDVAWLRPTPSVRAAFVDLTGDGRVDHVQVRDDAATRCAAEAERVRATEEAALPVLDLQGRGPLRVGAPLAEAAGLVAVQDEGDSANGTADDGGPSCRLAMGDGEPGLLYLVLSDPGPGGPVVAGITVDAGRTDTGLEVGDPPLDVADAYPGLTAAYLEDRWGQGLSADWQLPGGVLRLWPRREQVPVVDVDAVLVGPRDVVGLVQVGPGC